MDPAKGKRGLRNLGNTCYINTTLQCLAHCPSFICCILAGKFRSHCKDATSSMIIALRNIYVQMWMEDTDVSPTDFLHRASRKFKGLMSMYEPNDINEFIVLLIDKLNDEICYELLVHPFKKVRYEDTPYDKQRERMDDAWLQSMRKEYSELKELFYGQLVSQIVCGGCGKVHHNYEVFSNMMVSIHGTSMEHCIDHHFQEEVVNRDLQDSTQDPWTCDACHATKPSVKTIRLWRNPKILLLSLKRFNAKMQKVNQEVAIPLAIDLQKYTLGPSLHKYELKSVGFHMGSFFGGHYFAVCRHLNNEWYIKDDETVQTMPASQLGQLGKGYLFCYELLSSS